MDEPRYQIVEVIGRGRRRAHKRRVVHRDLEPANVMLTEEGHVKAMDFGLAARVAPSDDVDQAMPVAIAPTQGVVTGTPAYMAPEQVRGEPADPTSSRSAFWFMILCHRRHRTGQCALVLQVQTHASGARRRSPSDDAPLVWRAATGAHA